MCSNLRRCKRYVMKMNEISLGYVLPSIEVNVTQDVIDKAALAHLDFNPVHTNIDWAARARVFGTSKTVAHGMFTISNMISVVLRGWGVDNIFIAGFRSKLTKPVPVGSLITAGGVVKEIHPRPKQEESFVVVEGRVVDQVGDTVALSDIKVFFRGQ